MRIRIGRWVVASLALAASAQAQSANSTNPTATTQPGSETASAATQPASPEAPAAPVNQYGKVIISSELDQARDNIAPSLGAVSYTIGPPQIESVPEGEDAPFQQVLLRAPGVVEDSFGQEHVRGEHGNLTYRVNGVILPEPLNGFGQELDTHLVDSVTLIDGTLPAQFGFRTAGIVDVTTKSGDTLQGGELSMYGGSYDTFEPSVSYGGTDGKLDYFVTGSFKHDSDGIENTTSSLRPLHDDTDQTRGFAYLSYHLSDTSRISLLLNGSYSDFQIPDTAGAAPMFTLTGNPPADSATLDENQNEQQYYSVVSFQNTVDKLSYQVSGFVSYGQIHFTPDPDGDLIFQGVAGEVFNSFTTEGIQADGAYVLNEQHTLRAGFIGDFTGETLNTTSSVFPVDNTGAQTSSVPETIFDDSYNRATSSGLYLQDEWQINKALTFNYGVRYDRFDANFDTEDQISPRANLVWKIDPRTTAHVGFARYFVPPPVQDVTPGTIAKFANTSNAPASTVDDPPRVERSDYYDAGISEQIAKPWLVNFDGFYKMAHQLVDLGQFGDAVILSPYNYKIGRVYGAELSSTYKQDGLSAFGNLAWVQTAANTIDSQEFTFASDELAYIDDHQIHLDHESEWTASAGVTYTWTDDRVYADILYGNGLRAGFANLQKEPEYYPVNIGYEHVFHPNGAGKNAVHLRFDILNVFDEIYQLRNGTGLGVNAPQYGQRRAFEVGLSYDF